jgi:hypothetical protein
MRQASSEPRRVPIPIRWLNAGGDLPRLGHRNQYDERPLMRSKRPPKCKFNVSELAVQISRARRDSVVSTNNAGASTEPP